MPPFWRAGPSRGRLPGAALRGMLATATFARRRLGVRIGRRLTHTYWAGWAGMAFRNPLRRAFSRLARAFPVDPAGGPLSSLILGAAVLRRGDSLVWFHEGERSPDGRLQPLRTGLGMLLARYAVPVVPVVFQGSFEALPRGRRVPRLRPITVNFGAALNPRHLEAQGKGATRPERIIDGLRAHMQKMLEELAAEPVRSRAGTRTAQERFGTGRHTGR